MNMPTTAHTKKRYLWIFFALTFFLTWIFWIPLALSGQDVMAGPLMIILLLRWEVLREVISWHLIIIASIYGIILLREMV